LQVTDTEGAFDQDQKTVVIDPSELSVLQINKAEVELGTTPPRIKLNGEIGLPSGVNFTDLAPQATARIVLADVFEVLQPSLVTFNVNANKPKKWEFEHSSSSSITKFLIDWQGSRYRFKTPGYPIKLISQVIMTTETVLTLQYKPQNIGAAFSVAIGGSALISFNAHRDVTSSNVPFVVDKPRRKVTLTLPFALQNTTVITIDSANDLVDRVINVGDDLKESVGRFRLITSFNGALLPHGVLTTPPALDLEITVGAQAYPGTTSIVLQVDVGDNEWEFDDDDD